MPKQKPTHGICRSCKTEFELLYFNGIVKSRLCIKCLVNKGKEKQKKAEKQAWKIEKAELKEKIKTHKDYQSDLQKEINKLIHLIDYLQPCISSGSNTGKRNAGHYYSVGSENSLRFNLHNIFIQTEYSNTYQHGDIHKYRIGLINTFGERYYNYVNDLKNTYPHIKLTKAELIEKTKLVRALIKGYKPYKLTQKQRIIERNKYNAIIGIYGVNYDFES